MGNATLADLRKRVAESLGMVGTGWCTTASASTTSYVDATTPDRNREAADYWNGGTLTIRQGTLGPTNELVDEASVSETETLGGTVTVSTVDPLDTSCYAVATSATAGSLAAASFPVAVTAGRIAEVSFWCKGDGTVCGRWGFRASTGATTDIVGAWATQAGEPTYVTAEQWTRVLRKVRIPTSATACTLDLYGAVEDSAIVYFDKPSVRMLGEERYISDYATGGTFTIAAMQAAINQAYEVYHKQFSLTQYTEAINRALIAAWPYLFDVREDESIVTASGYESYSIPDNIAPEHIIKVEIESNTSDNTVPWQRHVFWRVRRNGANATLQFTHDGPPDGRNVRLTYLRPVAELKSDFDTVDERWIPYIVARAKAELYEQKLGKTAACDRQQVGQNRDAFYEEAAYALRQITMQFPATHVKPAYHGFH